MYCHPRITAAAARTSAPAALCTGPLSMGSAAGFLSFFRHRLTDPISPPSVDWGRGLVGGSMGVGGRLNDADLLGSLGLLILVRARALGQRLRASRHPATSSSQPPSVSSLSSHCCFSTSSSSSPSSSASASASASTSASASASASSPLPHPPSPPPPPPPSSHYYPPHGPRPHHTPPPPSFIS
eukprot:8359851-Pyramimonas_sp.AAC.1